jgi:hypothetical protein
MDPRPMTEKQRASIDGLARRLHLPPRMLAGWVRATYQTELDGLSITALASVIDRLAGWEDVPAEIYRANGQVDLPGMG